MVYDRNRRNINYQGEYNGRQDQENHGQDYGNGGEFTNSSARDYAAARDDRGGYGQRERMNQGYGREGGYGRQGGSGSQGDYGRQGNYGGQRDYGRESGDYRGSYGAGGRRFENEGQPRDQNRDRDQNNDRGGYGRQPQGYDYEERGFFARAGDEVRSWFGDDDAERRREADARHDERDYDQGYRAGGRGDREAGHRDADYHSWRNTQIAAFDRDYDEYRRENQSKFHQEFATWRNERQGQRDSLGTVKEHMEVVGSDGEHVGTVDKVRGDRIILTKNDQDAGGRHHSIPSRWIQTVDDKVTLRKSAQEAKDHWRDEERNGATFGNEERDTDQNGQRTSLNRSFSGTY